MAQRDEALRKLIDVIFNAAAVGVEEVARHEDAVLPLSLLHGSSGRRAGEGWGDSLLASSLIPSARQNGDASSASQENSRRQGLALPAGRRSVAQQAPQSCSEKNLNLILIQMHKHNNVLCSAKAQRLILQAQL